MVEAVVIGGGSGGIDQVYAAKTAGAGASAATSIQATQAEGQFGASSIYLDPTTGILVTEYYSSNGQVSWQMPSEVVMSYLRAGMPVPGDVSSKAGSEGQAVQSSTAQTAVVAAPAAASATVVAVSATEGGSSAGSTGVTV